MIEQRLENLGSGVTAVITKEHGFGTDALLLADFAAPKANDSCCDMGTGCGVIPLLWCREERKKPVTAIEISPAACGQLKKAAQISDLTDKINILNLDIREIKAHLPAGLFDVVTMNPPYKAQGAGILSAEDSAAVARHGIMCSLEDMCEAAAWLLRFGGKFCVCLRPERLCELMCVMSRNGLEPKRLKTVSKRSGTVPWLILVEGRRGGKPGMKVEPQLNVYDENGGYTEYMRRLYSEYECEKQTNLLRKGASE